jgi:hypothetical protein
MDMGVTVTQYPDQNELIAGDKKPVTRAYAIAAAVGVIKRGQLLIQTGGATTPPSVFGAPLPLVTKYAGAAITTNDVIFIAECDYDTTGHPESHVRQGGYVQGQFRARSLTGYGLNISAELLAQGIDVINTVPMQSGLPAIPATAA